MNSIYVISAIGGAVLCLWLWISERKKIVEIKFSLDPLEWFVQILFTMILVLVAFALEFYISKVFAEIGLEKTSKCYIFGRFIENGLLIPFISVALSLIFEYRIEANNLDYHLLYSEKISKICFSANILGLFLACLFGVLPKCDPNDQLYDLLLNRILMWGITAIGIWFGFGVGCKGRIEETNAVFRDIDNEVSPKEKRQFWLAIFLAVALCISLYIALIPDYKQVLTMAFLLFSGGYFCVALVYFGVTKIITNPSEKQSAKQLGKVIKRYRKKGYGKGRYRMLSYYLKDRKVVIMERKVIYKGHEQEDEFIDIFGEKTFQYTTDTKAKDVSDELQEIIKKQDKYIKDEFEKCREIAQKKKSEIIR